MPYALHVVRHQFLLFQNEDKKFNMSSFPVNVGDTSMFSDDKRTYTDIPEESKLNELLQNDELSKSFQKNQISLLGDQKVNILSCVMKITFNFPPEA